MRLRIALLALSAGVLSSCGLMVDNTIAPPPIAAEKGDLYLDATTGYLPEVGGGSGDYLGFMPAGGLGVGYAFTNQDFMYASIQSNFNEDFALTTSVKYQRKLFLTGAIEHFIGAQYQYLYAQTTEDETTYSNDAHGLGISYFGRLNAPGAIQPYLGLQVGFGVDDVDFNNTSSIGTLALGLQYRFADDWECRLEFNQNMGGDLEGFDPQWGGGINASIRYIFP